MFCPEYQPEDGMKKTRLFWLFTSASVMGILVLNWLGCNLFEGWWTSPPPQGQYAQLLALSEEYYAKGGFDDDGDGLTDEDGPDDNGDLVLTEDPAHGVDSDGDGRINEDPGYADALAAASQALAMLGSHETIKDSDREMENRLRYAYTKAYLKYNNASFFEFLKSMMGATTPIDSLSGDFSSVLPNTIDKMLVSINILRGAFTEVQKQLGYIHGNNTSTSYTPTDFRTAEIAEDLSLTYLLSAFYRMFIDLADSNSSYTDDQITADNLSGDIFPGLGEPGAAGDFIQIDDHSLENFSGDINQDTNIDQAEKTQIKSQVNVIAHLLQSASFYNDVAYSASGAAHIYDAYGNVTIIRMLFDSVTSMATELTLLRMGDGIDNDGDSLDSDGDGYCDGEELQWGLSVGLPLAFRDGATHPSSPPSNTMFWVDEEFPDYSDEDGDYVDNDGDNSFNEDSADDDWDGLVNEDPTVDGIDQDGDGLDGEDPVSGIDNDGDSVDSDGDGYCDGQEWGAGTNPFDSSNSPWTEPVYPASWFIDEDWGGIDEDL